MKTKLLCFPLLLWAITTAYNNPLDSTIGASYVSLNAEDTTIINFCYDGNVKRLRWGENR